MLINKIDIIINGTKIDNAKDLKYLHKVKHYMRYMPLT